MATQETHDQQPILLQSRDYSKLLDVIDLLRSQGVSQYVPLPQLIVCGDQSAGKSSVLEAVSGVRFPTKDTVCTRFATELILRRGLETSVTVGITPGKERSPEERAALSSFRVPGARIEDFPSLVDSAKEKMGLNNNTKAFSSDVLRVEVTGPNQTNLTLVDLPGLIHAENKQQSTDDVNMVYSLVKAYMAESRSIILAVVSAKNDYANQIVTKLARDVDPKGIRTLGIITKPDTLHVGSESERDFVNLAKNEDVTFRLGWHVLRNRDYDKRNSSAQERDDTERYFFSQGIWTTLPMNILGLDALKPRLSRVLRDQIISEFPRLIDDIKTGIGDCQNRLAKLGEAREGLQEQRRYLMQIGQSFTTLIKAAVGGVYSHEFFGSAKTTEGYSKRLRAVIQALLMDFADDMRRNGHDRKIVDDVDNNDGGDGDDDGDDNDENSGPTEIARDDYVSEVRTLMRRSRGCELPGTFNPLVIGDLFFQQARPWKDIVTNHCHKVLEASRLCVDFSLLHLTDDRTRAGLHREIVDPALERISEALEQKVLELMKPHQKGHPITYNRTFTETVQNAREEHRKRELQRRLRKFFKLKPGAYAGLQNVNVAELLNVLAKETKQDMELYACSEAADCMEAYYQVAMVTAVDNIAVLGIEVCLLEKLSEMLSAEVVMNLDDAVVEEIAGEEEDSRKERARALKKLASLESGLRDLRRLGRHKQGVPDSSYESEINAEEASAHDSGTAANENGVAEETYDHVAECPLSESVVPEPSSPTENLSPFNETGMPRSDWSRRHGAPRRSSVAEKKARIELLREV